MRAARCGPPRPTTLARRRLPRQLGGLPVVADASRAAGNGAGGAGQRLHRPRRRAGRQRPDAGDGRPSGATRVDRRDAPPPSPIITAGSGQPRVRQLTDHCQRRPCSIRCCAADPSARASPTTTTPPASASSCPRSTLANWAAKTANLLRDELGAGPGSRVAVLLPAHWQTAAVLFGVWWIGAEVVLGRTTPTSRCAPQDRLDEADAAVGRARSRCCRWTRSASRCPTCRSA